MTELREEKVETMKGREYTTEFEDLVYKLQSREVAFRHIPDVIADCWEFVGKKATNLPTEKTVSRMNISRLGIGQKHLEVYQEQ